jgi:hypothetical protein
MFISNGFICFSQHPTEYIAESDAESDLEEIYNEAADMKRREREAEEEEAAQARLEAETQQAAFEAAADKMDNAEMEDIGRPMDEEAMAELAARRNEWLMDTLAKTIENVLEMEFVDAVNQAIDSMATTFSARMYTDEERIAISKTHMVNLLRERVKNKRMFGERMSFMV